MLGLETDWKNNPESYASIRRFIEDAIEDCVKAKHDAIDAMVHFVVTWFDDVEREIGLQRLISIFPEYLTVISGIINAQDKISHSREHRGERRDAVYDELEKNEYEQLLKLYTKMKVSRDRVQAISDADETNSRASRKRENWLIALTVISTVAALALVAFEISKLVAH